MARCIVVSNQDPQPFRSQKFVWECGCALITHVLSIYQWEPCQFHMGLPMEKVLDVIDKLPPEILTIEAPPLEITVIEPGSDVQYFREPGPNDNPNGPGWYFADETVTPNMQVIKHIGPYQDQETAKMALRRFNDAVRALRGPGGLYIHLREK